MEAYNGGDDCLLTIGLDGRAHTHFGQLARPGLFLYISSSACETLVLNAACTILIYEGMDITLARVSQV